MAEDITSISDTTFEEEVLKRELKETMVGALPQEKIVEIISKHL